MWNLKIQEVSSLKGKDVREMSPWEQTKGKGSLVCFVSYSGCGDGGGEVVL